jgi:replicative DNA helicase
MVAAPTREPFTPPAAAPPQPRLTRLGDLLGEWEADALAAHAARVEGRPRGPVTGLRPLDQELGGALPVGVTAVHGGPGVGKTAFGLQASASCGCPALFVTCEMAPLELLRRHTARVTGTYLGRLKSGELAPADSLTLARQAVAAAPLLTLADATQAPADADWLRDAARAARGDAEHLLLVLDSLHSWADALGGEAPEYERLNAALAILRQLAGALNCAVLVTVERNRATMKGGLHAGAGTRKIEYGAEVVIDLTADENAAPAAPGTVALLATLDKNRHGSPGRKLPLRFTGALQRFEAV